MGYEHRSVGLMLYVLRKLRWTPLEFKVDSILYRPNAGQRRKKANALKELTFRDLSSIRDQFERTGGARRLDEYCSVPPIHSDDHPFRVLQANEEDLMKCEPGLPKRMASLSRFAKPPERSCSHPVAWRGIQLCRPEHRATISAVHQRRKNARLGLTGARIPYPIALSDSR